MRYQKKFTPVARECGVEPTRLPAIYTGYSATAALAGEYMRARACVCVCVCMCMYMCMYIYNDHQHIYIGYSATAAWAGDHQSDAAR